MQVIHNQHLAEFYVIENGKRFTVDKVNHQWRCSCYQPDCSHTKAVQNYIKRGIK